MCVLNHIRFEKVLLFIVNFVIIFAAAAVFQGQNFSADGYGIYVEGLESNAYTYLSSYRFFGAFLLKFLCYFKHNFFDSCTVDTIVFSVSSCIAVSLLTIFVCGLLKVTEEKKKFAVVLVDVSLLIAVLNISSANMMTFPECEILIGSGFLLCFIAAALFTGKTSVFSYCCSLLMIIAFTGIFQQFYAVFAVLLITICAIKAIQDESKGIVNHLRHYIIPASCYFSGGVLYYIIAKLLLRHYHLTGNPRAETSVDSLFHGLLLYLTRQGHILKGVGYINSYKVKVLLAVLTVAFFLMSLLIVSFSLIKKRQISKLILLILAVFAAFCLAFLPGIIENAEGVNVRTILGFYSLFFLFTVLLIASGVTDKIVSTGILGVLSFLLSLFVLIMNGNELTQKAGNAIDNVWAKQVVYEIDKYQNESSQQIDFVYICDDGESQLCYMDINWARERILKIFDKNNVYIVSEMTPEEKSEFFKDKTWECFDADEQIVFEGNKAYVCAY